MFPASLTKEKIWILFKFTKEENGHTKKEPYSALYNGRAKSNDSNTWSNYEVASKKLPEGFDCLGVAIVSPFVFIDLDNCFDAVGNYTEVAKDILPRFKKSYIEKSQSGSGIHIIAKGNISKAVKTKDVEIYSGGRFCAITGNVIQQYEPSNEQESIDYIFNKYKKPDAEKEILPSYEVTKSDSEIIELLCRDKTANDLFHGNWQGRFPSQSEADLYLCGKLAFWCDRVISQKVESSRL